MRIVIDTNVVVSAVFFGGKPRALLEKVFLRDLDAFASEDILFEYRDTIDVIRTRYPNKPIVIPISQIASVFKLVESKTKIHVCRDPDDDKFISCAIDSGSLYIVSGDRDLLDIGQYEGIEIITVTEFLNRIQHD